MKLENFYACVKVGIADKELKDRIQPLLDDVISRLPEEKPFQIKGIMGFAKYDPMLKYLNRLQPNNLIVKDIKKTGPNGYCRPFITETGDIYSYFICFMTDHFHYWSDDWLKGLIIHELSHLKYCWILLQQEKPNLVKLNLKDREIRINQILGEYMDIPSYEYFELEKIVNAEAVKLGFEKEIVALDGKGVVYDEIEKCWRRIR